MNCQYSLNMPKYSINYYNARGFAEISRWIFAAAGEEYEDNRWEPEQWPEHKKSKYRYTPISTPLHPNLHRTSSVILLTRILPGTL